jgi:hypothetical protein
MGQDKDGERERQRGSQLQTEPRFDARQPCRARPNDIPGWRVAGVEQGLRGGEEGKERWDRLVDRLHRGGGVSVCQMSVWGHGG